MKARQEKVFKKREKKLVSYMKSFWEDVLMLSERLESFEKKLLNKKL